MKKLYKYGKTRSPNSFELQVFFCCGARGGRATRKMGDSTAEGGDEMLVPLLRLRYLFERLWKTFPACPEESGAPGPLAAASLRGQ